MFKLKRSKAKSAPKKVKKDDANSSTPIVPEDESSNDKSVEIASPENSRDGFENQLKQLSPATLDLADDKLWTQSDQVLLRSLMEVYQGNFCVISKCMKNKSCKQVKFLAFYALFLPFLFRFFPVVSMATFYYKLSQMMTGLPPTLHVRSHLGIQNGKIQ